MYEHAQEYGIVYHDAPPYEVLSTKWLNYDEIILIKRVEEMLEVYYNSGQFEITMKLIDKIFDSAFEFFQSLGNYYEENGYFGMSHSRIRRCEIFLEFIKERVSEDVYMMLEEAMVFDFYFRENCKSRPKWAPEPASFRKVTHAFCKNGKLSHIEPFHYRFPEKYEHTISELPVRNEKTLYAVFQYDKRNPLDHQAFVEYIEYEQD